MKVAEILSDLTSLRVCVSASQMAITPASPTLELGVHVLARSLGLL